MTVNGPTCAGLVSTAEGRMLRHLARRVFPLTGPIGMKIEFILPRPSGHFLPINSRRTEPELRDGSPPYPDGTPDLDKLVRAILDALTDAQLWGDDAQVVFVTASKHWPDAQRQREGAHITLGRMNT